jgi:hypothetical protein
MLSTLGAVYHSFTMDTLYMFAKSFKDAPFLNRRRVDWSIGLTVACVKGAFASRYFGSYGFEFPQLLYLYQSGSKMIGPVFRMLKDGPVEDEVEEVTLEWAQYGVFFASFHAAWIWGCVLATVKESSIFRLALLSAILCVGVHWLFFKPSISLDQAYIKYRQLESQISYWRGWLLWQLWLRIRPVAENFDMPVGRMLTQLGRGMRILPPVPGKGEKPYRYKKMSISKEIRLLRLVPSPFSCVVRCCMEHYTLDQLPDYEAISYSTPSKPATRSSRSPKATTSPSPPSKPPTQASTRQRYMSAKSSTSPAPAAQAPTPNHQQAASPVRAAAPTAAAATSNMADRPPTSRTPPPGPATPPFGPKTHAS